MRIDILTLFPKMLAGPFEESIIKRAEKKGLVKINVHNLRDYAIDDYGTVDDKPYGGGIGMILRPEPIVAALKNLYNTSGESKATPEVKKTRIVLLSASGKLYKQSDALLLSRLSHLILICGHYEGVDQRIADYFCDEEISIGDYVLTGGEIPAMVIIDSVVRLIPGVLKKEEAVKQESFSTFTTSEESLRNTSEVTRRDSSDGEQITLLEFPQYTRPAEFQGYKVPEILLKGHHAEIEKWRKEQSLARTRQNRPDLLNPS